MAAMGQAICHAVAVTIAGGNDADGAFPPGGSNGQGCTGKGQLRSPEGKTTYEP